MNRSAIRYSLVIDSPLGRLGVLVADQQLHRLDYLAASTRRRAAASAFEYRVVQALEDYFDNPQSTFSLPVVLAGTAFQQRVWQALRKIPSGDTLTYGELAARLGSGARAVGNACRRNPVSIIVPCHRVVAAGGVGGYSGSTAGPEISRKRWLLQHENPSFPALKNRVLTPDRQVHQLNQGDMPA